MPEAKFEPFDVNKAVVDNPLGITPLNCNNAAVMIGDYDVRIVFSEVVAIGANQPTQLHLRANLAMSPTFLKSLQKAIEQTIKVYEEMHGEIQWPPQPLKTA